jgi:pimeloyl-ACP methyl ester carboxylesterase
VNALAPRTTAFERARVVKVGTVDAHIAESGAGPPILMLHGNPDSHHVWLECARRLAPRYRCIAPDLPGFGESHAPRDFDCSLDNQAAYVAGILDVLELPSVHLCVHDIGGPYGLSFAAKHPERVRTLTIFNTSYFPDFKWHFWGRVWRTPVLGELSMVIAWRGLFVKGMRKSQPLLPVEYANHAWDAFDREARRMVLRWYRYMTYSRRLPGWDEKLLAATRTTPKQVIWGTKDPFIVGTTADRYEAPVHRLDDCGHWVMAERPDEAARLIEALVATAPGA